MKKLALLIIGLLSFSWSYGQEVTASIPEKSTTFLGFPFGLGIGIMILLFFILIIIALLFAIMIDFGKFSYRTLKDSGIKPKGVVGLFGIFEGDLSTLTSEYNDTVIHEYDGIQEYDNDMPPWWKAGFYAGVAFGIIYMLVYHVFGVLPLQAQEYENELSDASKKYANVDQVYEKPSEDKSALKAASEIYTKNCKTCHGAQAEGLVGPNLTDKFWLHGGSINDIYTTIKYGKTEKNMPAWKSNFSNQQVYEIASYIMSLEGSNPPNAKEPQGEEKK